MTKRVLGAFLAVLALSVGACNPLNLKWTLSPADGETVLDRLKIECADSGGVWTETGCDPPLPWRGPVVDSR